MAGPLPTEGGPQISYEELSVAFKAARESVLSISEQVKALLSDIEGPIPESKVSMAREITETIRRLNLSGEIPVKIQGADIGLIAIFSLCLAILASLYPAWKASRLNPVEAIRYE